MTVTTVRNPQPTRRSLPLKALAFGLAAGLLSASAAGSPSAAGFVPAVAQVASADPAKQVPGVVSVSAVDFKRGDGGAGKLILRFDGEGANPDLRTQGSSVIVNIGNASLPASLQRPLNVTDFATPLPLRVISEMMGVSQADRHDLPDLTPRVRQRGAAPSDQQLTTVLTSRPQLEHLRVVPGQHPLERSGELHRVVVGREQEPGLAADGL